MARRAYACLLTALIASAVTSVAGAHITLLEPAPRHGKDDLKFGPCGIGPSDTRTTDPALITTFQPGETITVRWIEGINHPSHFRIALAPSDVTFADPKGFDDTSGGQYVLLDGIEDSGGPNFEAQVTLPNEPCPECTLQLIQVMKDKAPWGDGDDIYYQCADLIIGDGTLSSSGGTGGTLVGSGGITSTGGTASGGAFGSGGTLPTDVPPAAEPEDDSTQSGCALVGSVGTAGPGGAFWLLLGITSIFRARRRASDQGAGNAR